MSLRRLIAVLLMAWLVVGVAFGLNLLVFVYTSNHQQNEELHIDRGSSFRQIIETLYEHGIISSDTLFKAYVVLSGKVGKVRAGDYTFPAQATPSEVLKMLVKGDFARLRVTLVEGWTLRDIAHSLGKYVNEAAFLSKASDPAFIASQGLPVSTLEGYLFPDTYEIYKPKNEEELLHKFVQHFKEVYERELAEQAGRTGLTQNQIIILASIVEKETAKKEEAPIVASVFLNRLKINMPLASDPTIIYGIPNFNGNLTRQDLERPGPYNSYLNPGFPPTPISNPGRRSIRAVLYPAQTDYLYFVSRGDGTHEFSKTIEEHQRAVYKYQIQKQRPTGTSETNHSSTTSPPSSQ